ncbi:dipeptidylpeptidase, partial [Coemansia sp. RSA 1933]
MQIAGVATFYALGSIAIAAAQTSTGRSEENQAPLDIRLFHSLSRAGPAVVSPDSTKLLFSQSRYDQDTNASATFISMVDVASGATTVLTPDEPGTACTNPLWIDDQTIGYMRSGALYQQLLRRGENGTEVFRPAVPISAVAYRPGYLTFVASVHPNATSLKESKRQDEAEKKTKKRIDSAQLFDNLWVRHWDEWMASAKPSVFAVSVNRAGEEADHKWTLGREVNLLKELDPFHDPLVSWSVDEYAVDKQGHNVAFVVRSPADDMAWRTDMDVYMVPVTGGKPKLLTGDVQGIASGPAFSPDGRRLAWLQKEAAAYESATSRIYVHDIEAGHTTPIARDWKLSPMALVWAADNASLYAVAGVRGDNAVFSVNATSGARRRLTGRGSVAGLRLVERDRLALLHSDQDRCSDIHILDTGTRTLRQVTDVNRRRLAGVYLGAAEDFWFAGARGDRVHGWLVKPPHFDATKRYPLALLIHGGPQQHNTHSFSHSQWNPNVYAAAGFVTMLVNFHGSSGYGQNFTDSITQQWGGYPYEDLIKGLDHVLATYAFVDPARMVALGASYGGYMVNWLNANTDRFRALVSHDGLFSTPAFWYATDELWFPEHDFGGVPYTSDARKRYEEFNPE